MFEDIFIPSVKESDEEIHDEIEKKIKTFWERQLNEISLYFPHNYSK